MDEKPLEKALDMVYNRDMKKMDFMAKQRSFTVGNDIKVKTKKLNGTDFDFWVQDNTKKIRDTVTNVEQALGRLSGFKIPQIVVVKKSRLLGIAGYNQEQDILFISDELHSDSRVKELLSGNYFAASDIEGVLKHELTHKKHWDSAKAFYKQHKKRYNTLEEAKQALDSDLVSYVKVQESSDSKYVKELSVNAYNSFAYYKNINELVAEVGVLQELVHDKELLNKVEGVLKWK